MNYFRLAGISSILIGFFWSGIQITRFLAAQQFDQVALAGLPFVLGLLLGALLIWVGHLIEARKNAVQSGRARLDTHQWIGLVILAASVILMAGDVISVAGDPSTRAYWPLAIMRGALGVLVGLGILVIGRTRKKDVDNV
jgi:hypothetical protein